MYRKSRELKIRELQGQIERKRKRILRLISTNVHIGLKTYQSMINTRTKELEEMEVKVKKMKYKNMSRKEKKQCQLKY